MLSCGRWHPCRRRDACQSRRFPAPWTYSEEGECFIVSCADGRPIAYVYYDDGPDMRRDVRKRMTRDEARRNRRRPCSA